MNGDLGVWGLNQVQGRSGGLERLRSTSGPFQFVARLFR